VVGCMGKLSYVLSLMFGVQLVSFMVHSDLVFAVGCPLSDLACFSMEYLFWCYVGHHVL